MKQKAEAVKNKETIYKALIVVLVVALLVAVAVAADSITGRWHERERRVFVVDAAGLSDGSGNTIDIHGTGKVGMSGWIIFQPSGSMNLTLWATGGGSITFKTADGKEYNSKWDSVDNCGYMENLACVNIRLTQQIAGLPGEMSVYLYESSEIKSGKVEIYFDKAAINFGNPNYIGTGLVVIN